MQLLDKHRRAECPAPPAVNYNQHGPLRFDENRKPGAATPLVVRTVANQ